MINFHRLNQITDADTEMNITFLQLFVEDTEQRIRRLMAAPAHDIETHRIEAHTVKGASANLGIDTIAEISGVLETHARNGQHDALKEHSDRLAEEFQRLKRFCKEHFGEQHFPG